MSNLPFIIVAIDGGAASGKSSTSRSLSERFNLLHADTGSYYRALTAELLRRGVVASDIEAVKAALNDVTLTTRVTARNAAIELSGHLIPDAEIRSPNVTSHVATFAAIPELRNALLEYQRSQAATARTHGFRGLVMEGRDIGSKIFPNADFRYFLFADPVARARRREEQGLHDQVARRDTLDGQRLKESLAGATVIDSTFLSLDQVVAQISTAIEAKLGSPQTNPHPRTA